jgi:hypothetical protein
MRKKERDGKGMRKKEGEKGKGKRKKERGGAFPGPTLQSFFLVIIYFMAR